MQRTVRTLLVLALVTLIATPVLAADKEKKKKKKKGRRARVVLLRIPKSIGLSDEQKKQVAAINKEFGPKLSEVGKKLREVLTPEQRKARAEAVKSARAAGKKGKEFRQAVNSAVTLSAEQKKQLAELRKARRAILQQAQAKFVDLLTDEQKKKLPKRKTRRKKKKKAE